MQIQVQLFLLVFMRISSFFVVSPGFSLKGMPVWMKISLAAGIAVPVFSLAGSLTELLSVPQFALLGIKEILFGSAIGFVTKLFFTAVDIAGSFVDYQVGFSMAEVFDPSWGVSSSYFGKVYYWTAMSIFFLTDIHHLMIRLLVHSFELFPVSALAVGDFGVEGILKLFSATFEMAFQLAAPFIIVALLTEILLGVLSRTVPQINVLILSMPLKVLVALVFTLVFLPTLIRNTGNLFPEMLKSLGQFIQSFS